MPDVFKRRTRASTERLRRGRKTVKSAIATAKNNWIKKQCETMNLRGGTKEAWYALGRLRSGLSKTIRQMKRPDGTICKTPEENAQVFYKHFEVLYGRIPSYDNAVLDILEQDPVVNSCDKPPSDEEIKLATL